MITASTPGQLNPWTALEKAGLLGPAARAPRDLAGGLDAATRDGLEDVVERVEAAGATFEVERGWLESKLTGEARRRLDASQVVDMMSRSPLGKKDSSPLVSVAGLESQAIRSLVDLQALDLACGLGVAAAGTSAPAARALLDLQARGWRFRQDYGPSSRRDGTGPQDRGGEAFIAWSTLSNFANLRATNEGLGKDLPLRATEDLLSLHYFEHGGPTEGLARASLAQGLRELERRGYTFSSLGRYTGGRDFDARVTYDCFPGEPLAVGRPGSVKVPFSEADFQDLSRLEQRITAGHDLYERRGKSVLERLGCQCSADRWLQSVMDDRLCPSLTADARAEVLTALMEGRGRYEGAAEDLEALARRIPDPGELRVEALWLARLRGLVRASADKKEAPPPSRYGRGSSGPDDDARLDQIRDRLAGETGSPEQHAQARDALLRLLTATGDLAAAQEAFDLVRMGAGPEGMAACVSMVERIAAAAPGGCDQAPGSFRAVLTHRLRSDSLEAATTRFCTAKATLATLGKGDRAVEVFTRIQEATRAAGGDSQLADLHLQRFLETLSVSRDFDQALQRTLHPEPAAKTGPVRVGDDGYIRVGGVRVPVRPSGPASA